MQNCRAQNLAGCAAMSRGELIPVGKDRRGDHARHSIDTSAIQIACRFCIFLALVPCDGKSGKPKRKGNGIFGVASAAAHSAELGRVLERGLSATKSLYSQSRESGAGRRGFYFQRVGTSRTYRVASECVWTRSSRGVDERTTTGLRSLPASWARPHETWPLPPPRPGD